MINPSDPDKTEYAITNTQIAQESRFQVISGPVSKHCKLLSLLLSLIRMITYNLVTIAVVGGGCLLLCSWLHQLEALICHLVMDDTNL